MLAMRPIGLDVSESFASRCVRTSSSGASARPPIRPGPHFGAVHCHVPVRVHPLISVSVLGRRAGADGDQLGPHRRPVPRAARASLY